MLLALDRDRPASRRRPARARRDRGHGVHDADRRKRARGVGRADGAVGVRGAPGRDGADLDGGARGAPAGPRTSPAGGGRRRRARVPRRRGAGAAERRRRRSARWRSCSLSWSCGSIYVRHAGIRADPITVTAWEMFFAGRMFLALGTVTGGVFAARSTPPGSARSSTWSSPVVDRVHGVRVAPRQRPRRQGRDLRVREPGDRALARLVVPRRADHARDPRRLGRRRRWRWRSSRRPVCRSSHPLPEPSVVDPMDAPA